VIMVGQNIIGRASDRRADMTYKDAEATFHEAEQIQAHLRVQDDAMTIILSKLEALETASGGQVDDRGAGLVHQGRRSRVPGDLRPLEHQRVR
jgi:hypothetical protein